MYIKTEQYPIGDRELSPSTIRFAPRALNITMTEVTTPDGRWYEHNGVRYPSITTLIKATDHEGASALREWRRRVGHEAAQKITNKAAENGTRWHKFCENFVAGEPTWSSLTNVGDLTYAAAVGYLLNEKIDTILASEERVVSTRYRIAGRMDLAVTLKDGRHAIIDFKTGSKPKQGNRLENYFLQGTFYADALTTLLEDVTIETVVIVQLCPHALLWQESTANEWREKLQERVVEYQNELEIQRAGQPPVLL